MRFVSDSEVGIFSEEEYNEKMSAACEILEKYRHDGMFTGFDGNSLYYEYYLSENSRGAVVVVHGLSEFTKKYQEFAWQLLNRGYDVFLYDQRSHGRSCRLTDRNDLIHVDHFSDYHKDLHCFIHNVVKKATQAPLYLYAHSMGGAAALEYLAEYPPVFEKTILAAPMIEPLTGVVPAWFARLSLGIHLWFCDGKKQFWFSHNFDPNHPFEKAQDESFARFRRNLDIRLAEPCYQTTPLSFRWVYQSVMQRFKLTSKRYLQKITTPILMFSAETDQVVCNKAQNKFAKNCPVCQQMTLPETTHAMLGGTQKTLQEHYKLLEDYFC